MEPVMSMFVCDRKTVRDFLNEQLREDERLDFLLHLDDCPNCWETVYAATKATHPHFYKRAPKNSKFTDAELKKLEAGKDRKEEIFEVA
jgi:hypothetical protein